MVKISFLSVAADCMDGKYRFFPNRRLVLVGKSGISVGYMRIPDNDVAKCKILCDGDSGCLFFNHNKPGKICYFMNSKLETNEEASILTLVNYNDGYLKGCDQGKKLV